MTENPKPPANENSWSKINTFISTYKISLLIGFTVLTALAGRVLYGVSIFQPLEEIASTQNEYRIKDAREKYKQEMVNNHLALGDMFLDLGQNIAAKIEFEKALKLDEFCSKAEMGLFKADIFDTIAKKGYDPEILAMRLKVLMKLDTAHAHAYMYMGDVYSNIRNNMDVGLAYYDSAIAKNPKMAYAYFGKALIYDRKGDNEQAEKMYKKALSISPWNRIFMGNLAYQYYRTKKYKEAILYCDSLAVLDPYYVVSHFTRAASYLCNGDLNSSINCYQWMINIMNDNKILAQETNAGTWFFIEGKDNAVYFNNNNEKRYYAFYSIALAYCLNEDYALCNDYLKIAGSMQLNVYRQQSINSLIKWDIDNLAAIQPKYAAACAKFKAAVNL